MSEINLGKIFKFLRLKWNIIVAIISILGVLICNLIPADSNFFLSFFIFLGMNAIVWTLIEIKLKLDDKNPSVIERFDDLRHARANILGHIYQCMKTNKSEELCIEFVGGRIRTISDIIREIKSEIEKDKIITKNVRFKIYAINPDCIKHWNFSKTQSDKSLKDRNEEYAATINSSKKQFLKFNELDIFKTNNIKIEVEFYDTFPLIYFCKIGNKHIYWGFFTWCNLSEDFLGENPCYYLERKHSHFDDFSCILSNRIDFFQNGKMQKRDNNGIIELDYN